MATLIQVQDDTWEELNKRKKRGESFDSVIKRALDEIPEVKQKVLPRARKYLINTPKNQGETK